MIEHRWKSGYMAIAGKTELLPIEWVNELTLPNRSEHAEDTLFNPMSMVEFAEDIKTNGLQHEAVIEVSRESRMARLIAGNHRIQVLEQEGETHIPVYAVIVDEFDFSHERSDGYEVALTDLVDRSRGFCVESPSKIFRKMSNLKYKNQLPHIK